MFKLHFADKEQQLEQERWRMNKKNFWKSGHKPTLFGSFLYFDISFMIWGMIGPLAVVIANDYPMDPVQKANLVALPILGGSLLRLVLGFMSDYIGPKLTGQIGMLVTIIPLLLGWLWVDSLEHLYVVALLLGVAGASFAAALPLASQWYPKEHQGLAMGIAGAGNSGTVPALLNILAVGKPFSDWLSSPS
jgi:NNP family nitrate/nitrite transporter-like MFS transporter